MDFDQQVYGGLQTTDPALIALQRSILAPQAYTANVDDTNLSGQMTAAYRLPTSVNAYATYATGFKSVGLNLNGVPTDARISRCSRAATVRPEDVRHIEVGLKTEPLPRRHRERHRLRHRDQGLPGAGRERGRRRAARLPRECREGARARRRVRRQRPVNRNLSFYGAAAYTDGKYVSFPDAPPPLEETGGPQVKDISGSDLPGISKWATLVRWRVRRTGDSVFGRQGEFFGALDTSYRSSFSSSATASRIWWSTATRCSTPASASAGPTAGRSRLVAQPARQGLLRAADGGAGQHRPLRRPAGRRPHGRRDDADSVHGESRRLEVRWIP